MLRTTVISQTKHPLFAEWWQLYETAFPASERRSLRQHAAALEHPAFSCMHLADAGGFAGIMAVWQWQGMLFLEHLAISPERRGQGLGHQALALLQGRVVLEIEPVADAVTERRLRFYQDCGFCRLVYPHVQLAYQAGQPDIPLWLLSRPLLTAAEVQHFEQKYHAGPMIYRDSVHQ